MPKEAPLEQARKRRYLLTKAPLASLQNRLLFLLLLSILTLLLLTGSVNSRQPEIIKVAAQAKIFAMSW